MCCVCALTGRHFHGFQRDAFCLRSFLSDSHKIECFFVSMSWPQEPRPPVSIHCLRARIHSYFFISILVASDVPSIAVRMARREELSIPVARGTYLVIVYTFQSEHENMQLESFHPASGDLDLVRSLPSVYSILALLFQSLFHPTLVLSSSRKIYQNRSHSLSILHHRSIIVH